jgi:serine/threonine-protein kinase RsbW
VTGAEHDFQDRVTARASANVFAVTIEAVPASVGPLRRAVSSFAAVHGASPAIRADIALAVSEAVTNAVLHGYGGGREGAQIHVIADYEDSAIEIVVADDGIGLNSEVDSDGLGLGLGLIATTAGRFSARAREPTGTEIWMRFEI